MLKRVITGAILAILLVVLVIFSDTLAFPIALGVCAFIGVHEMLGCIGMRKNIIISVCMYAMTVTTTVISIQLTSHSVFIATFASILFCILMLMFACSVFSHGAIPYEKVCITFTSCTFVIIGFLSLVLLRDMEVGKYVFVLAFLGPWITDTFAYLTGFFLGRHKLIPDVSPKKTIEGSVGGTLFCIGFCALYGYIFRNYVYAELPPVYVFAVLGLIIAFVSQVGDLIFSLIKRKYGIKDYGFIFPGHGGILDRFDSIIATAPLLLIFFEAITRIG
ncbi:MAG: phosphatidate cytidylyltransferase [Clostridia bacterium]|nr:phosphatidate cytidylyltransferase [Clostridia bacterium]